MQYIYTICATFIMCGVIVKTLDNKIYLLVDIRVETQIYQALCKATLCYREQPPASPATAHYLKGGGCKMSYDG